MQKRLADRANEKRRARAAALRRHVPVMVYPPGHFTAPVRAWWPDWRPYDQGRFERGAAERSARAAQTAEENRRLGRGFGTGTMDLPRTPSNPAPVWM